MHRITTVNDLGGHPIHSLREYAPHPLRGRVQEGILVDQDPPVPMLRPRVKPEHAPYRVAGGKIRIGGVSFGLAAEVSDPDGWVWTMLSAMDGSRDLPEIIEHVRAAHPAQAAGVLRRGALQLLRTGYVEDVAGPVPDGLTERDMRRYDRAVGYYRWMDLIPRESSWEPQARLRDARVTILGVGGTGGVAALALAASGVGHLHCVDPDEVELSNLSRQILYSEDDLGKPKADSAVARLRRLNTDVEVTGQRMEATGIDDVLGLAQDCDVLLLGADRPPELRVWTNRACLAAKRPWVDVGYHGPLVQAAAFVPGEGPCWECTRLALRDSHAEEGASPGDSPHRREAVFSAVGAVPAGISGYLGAHLLISLVTGIPPVVPGRIETLNLAALDAPLALDGPPHPECEACGPAR
jgi:molybdopterin/thiamine biosynthesis adenylyltransferase